MRLLTVLITFILTGCGLAELKSQSSKDGQTFTVWGQEITVLDGGNLSISTNSVSGSGVFGFSKPIEGGLSSGANFNQLFQIRNQGKITLLTYANRQLEKGVEVNFQEAGADTITLSLQKDKTRLFDLTQQSLTEDGDNFFEIGIDVHNNESPAHVMGWNKQTGNVNLDLHDSAIFNTEGKTGHGNGAGTFWGYRLENATIEAASVSAAIYKEEEHAGHNHGDEGHDGEDEDDHDHDSDEDDHDEGADHDHEEGE